MENAPIDNIESPIDGSSSKKKRRKSFELGRAAVDVKEPEQESHDKPKTEEKAESKDSWLSKFTEKNKDTDAGQKEEENPDHFEHTENVPESEAPVDGTLSPQEKQTVIQAIAEEAAQNLPEHDVSEDPEAAVGDMLVAEFYEKLEENPNIDEAAQTAAAEAGLELPDEAIAELISESASEETLEDDLAGVAEPDEELVFDRAAEALPLDAEADEDEDPLAGTAPAGGAPAGAAGIPAGGGHGGTVPPTSTGYGGPGMPFGPAGGFGGSPGVPNFNTIPSTPSKPKAPVSAERLDDRGSPAVFFVAGGIIGYLIGRRRGRINTEKKLLPVQKKLEKQVEDLHWQIKAKESQIRKVAAEKVRQDGPAVVEVLAAKRAAKAGKQQEQALPAKAERFKEVRHKAPEANILHTAKAPEHIGHMLMSAEIPSAAILPKAEQQISKPSRIELKQSAEKPAPVLNEKSVETLNRAELLQLSEQIVVEGSSLRQIYETHLVGERGLRRLIVEHLRGGDMAKALKQEITEREIDFERDPVMRDIAPAGSNSSTGGGTVAGGKTALDQLVKKAEAKLPATSEQAAFYKARAAYEIEQSHKQKQRQQVVDASFAGIITVLLGAVIYLFITRG